MAQKPPEQLEMWPARATDPYTSHEGAKYVAPHLSRLHRMTMDFIGRYPDLTARELTEATGVDGLWKRVSELERKNLIFCTDIRECTVTKRLARTWRLR